MAMIGLVLSGGGARAAYQVGALRALSEVIGRDNTSPFKILTGISAGAINAAALAADGDSFSRAVEILTDTWMSLTPDRVYRTDTPTLASLGLRWFKDLTTGGVLGKSRATYLLDTQPLRELLQERMDLGRLRQHFKAGNLRGVALSATNYKSGSTVSFYDGAPEIEPWVRYNRLAFRESLRVDHVMASAAIPLFFPPVVIDGKPFGDGGVRMTTPLSPAIHLGADKLLAIGVRYARSTSQQLEINQSVGGGPISMAQIGGVLLNAVFLDAVDNDIERLERINRTLGLIPEATRRGSPDALRPIPALLLRPTQDLGTLAKYQYDSFPAVLRHLLRGIGATPDSGSDLLSYLAFQKDYVGKLIELGYSDTLARQGEIEAFLAD
jgi:NTE family protein